MTDQDRIDAAISRAQSKARDLGRWDAIEAIYDLLANEIPRDAYNAIGLYLATESWDVRCRAYDLLGGGDYAGWCFDVVAALGTWVSWDLGDGRKFGLSQFERWTIPERPTEPTAPAVLYPEGHPTHPIRVYRETGKGPLPDEMRWFTAAQRGLLEHVATYDAPADIDEPAFVAREAVKEVERMHPGPGVWLVYL